MKTKQLAKMLIQILGIYFFIGGIPSVISGLLMVLAGLFSSGTAKYESYEWTYSVGGVIQLLVGIFIIVKSRKIAEFLCKGDDE
jgi:ABC-type antimicrobial peptide transport system permease subunit